MGDAGYPLKTFLLSPFQQPRTEAERNFNHRFCSIRVKIEQAFGQVKRRFPGLHQGLRVCPEKCVQTIIACMILHNIAKDRNQPDLFDGEDYITENSSDTTTEEVDHLSDGKVFRDLLVLNYFS